MIISILILQIIRREKSNFFNQTLTFSATLSDINPDGFDFASYSGFPNSALHGSSITAVIFSPRDDSIVGFPVSIQSDGQEFSEVSCK